MRTYQGVKNDVEGVIARLEQMPNDKSFFEEQRRRCLDDAADAEIAAWLIFLNRTSFNGLYRVNRRGESNVPFVNM